LMGSGTSARQMKFAVLPTLRKCISGHYTHMYIYIYSGLQPTVKSLSHLHVLNATQRTAPEEAPVKIRRRSVCHRAAIGPASPPSRVDRANPCRQLTRLLGLTTQAEHFSCFAPHQSFGLVL
jgi:hypothetical protein